MAVISLRETKEFKLGREGEHLVAKMLQEKGYGIMPAYDYSGPTGDKAPRLQGRLRSFVLPDLFIAAHGESRWVEVKAKSAATYYVTGGWWEHGIDARLYEEYLGIQEDTGTEVWLAVYEVDTGDVLIQTLDELGARSRRYYGTKMGRSGMVFFRRDDFDALGNVRGGA